ncbi:hypothetical protein B0A55_10495 [Friedmanniomyces simplex]|uniref:Uncharacterized protein n=1 Tax=Friedmanniomyces simplex TaxID=329884 RepID=A0A4U0WR53_9PEZI|nr:hypothetical protein B0A55_10495 [Friedmanniomyces simplex]
MAIHSTYGSLPPLTLAHDMFEARDTTTKMKGPIRDVFLKHGMHDRYGVSLLHKHFDLAPNERLVEYHDVSTPWTLSNTDDHEIPTLGGYVVPQNYKLEDGKLAPFEFAMQYERPNGTDAGPEFLRDLSRVLEEHNLTNVLGLRKRPPPSDLTLEVTQGRANIMVPPSAADGPAIGAFWTFGEGVDEELSCFQICLVYCGIHFPEHSGNL